MSDYSNFKCMADKAMGDINVSDSLKKKVLQRCVKRHPVPIGKLVAAAACGILIFGIINFSGVLQLKTQTGEQGNQESSIFSAANEQTAVAPGQSDINILNEPGAVTDWLLSTPEEAAESFGSGFLTPSFIPEGYKPGTVFASGTDSMKATKVILNYIAEERTFMIIEQKSSEMSGFINYKVIDINGAEGYIRAAAPNVDGNTEVLDTEVHWRMNGVHYSVAGLISQEDAIKVARSMK